MSLGSLCQSSHKPYPIGMSTVQNSRVTVTHVPTKSRRPSPSSKRVPSSKSSGIDHWSIVLLYSMGVGTVAVVVLFFLVLLAVFLYGQFVWSFTQWDLADVSLAPYQSLGYLLLAGTFLAGTGFGLWLFGGSAWTKPASPGRDDRPR